MDYISYKMVLYIDYWIAVCGYAPFYIAVTYWLGFVAPNYRIIY